MKEQPDTRLKLPAAVLNINVNVRAFDVVEFRL